MEFPPPVHGRLKPREGCILRTYTRPRLPIGSRPQTGALRGLAVALPADPPVRLDAIGFALRRAQLAVYADLNQTLAEVGLRPAQFAALDLIGEKAGSSQGQVSEALGIEKANFVAIVAELAQRGLVLRRKSVHDARSYRLELTAAGRALRAHALAHQSVHESRLSAALGDQARRELLDLLGRLCDAF